MVFIALKDNKASKYESKMFQHMVIYSLINDWFAVAPLLGFYSTAECSSCRCDVPLFSSHLSHSSVLHLQPVFMH